MRPSKFVSRLSESFGINNIGYVQMRESAAFALLRPYRFLVLLLLYMLLGLDQGVYECKKLLCAIFKFQWVFWEPCTRHCKVARAVFIDLNAVPYRL